MVLEKARLVRELDEVEKDRQSMATGLDVPRQRHRCCTSRMSSIRATTVN